MSGPLEGIRILDLTWVLSGPFATMTLSDLGAEVIKIERLKVGDIARGNGPHINGVSTYFTSLNRGKKSVTLNLTTKKGKEIFLGLAQRVDVVVENFVPGTMKRLGLDYPVLKEINPRLIFASCSGFGQTGPYSNKPALDIIVQSMGGIVSVTGEPGRPPVKPGASIGDITAGLFLAVSILAALNERHKSGLGQAIDISMMDCQMALQENAFVRYLATGEIPERLGTRHPVFTPFQVFESQDGYVAIATMGGAQDQWPIFCSVIGRLDIIDDPRFESGWLRTQNYAILEPIMNAALKTKTTQEWLKDFEAVSIPCGPVNTIAQVAADPQVAHRNMIVEVQHPKSGNFKVVNSPVKLSRTPGNVKKGAPELGENTEEVLKQMLGVTDSEIKAMREQNII
jgi:CoA:oxalate CoA-transferase